MWIAMVFHLASFLIVQNVLLENVSCLAKELQAARWLDVEHLVSECVRPGELHLRPETAQLLPVLLQHSAELLGRELQVLALQLETKVIRMFPKISQSQRRPLLGPSPG